MSSAVYIKAQEEEVPFEKNEWEEFCAKHNVIYSPNTVGGNVYYRGEVEVLYTPKQITVKTYFYGDLEAVAKLVCEIWQQWTCVDVSVAEEILPFLLKQ